MNFVAPPKAEWEVAIGNMKTVHVKLNFWQRMWMRFIGWKVRKIDE